MLKDLITLELRSWVSHKLNLGNLEVQSGVCILTYHDGARRFQVYFPKKRGPRNIVSVHTQCEKCVTKEVFEAMGPSHNFHGIVTTPRMLGYPDGLKVTYRSGVTKHYLGEDVIQSCLQSQRT